MSRRGLGADGFRDSPGRPAEPPVGRICSDMYSHAHDETDGRGRGGERVRRRRGPPPAADPSRRGDRRDHGRLERGGDARRPPAAPRAAGRPGARGDHPGGAVRPRRRVPRRCRTASPPPSPRRCRTTRSSSTAARTSGYRPAGLGDLLRRRPRRLLALRPARAGRAARAARRRDPHRGPRLLPDRVHAGVRPRGAGRHRRRVAARRGGRLRHLRRRQGPEAQPARLGGDGLGRARTPSAARTGTPPRSPRTSPR